MLFKLFFLLILLVFEIYILYFFQATCLLTVKWSCNILISILGKEIGIIGLEFDAVASDSYFLLANTSKLVSETKEMGPFVKNSSWVLKKTQAWFIRREIIYFSEH